MRNPPPPRMTKEDVVAAGQATTTKIREIAAALRAFRSFSKDKLLVLLLHDMTGFAKRDIQTILNAIPEIEKTYLQPVKEK